MRIISKTVLNEVINLTATDPDYKTVISFNIEDTYLSKICKNVYSFCSRHRIPAKTVPTLLAFTKVYQDVVKHKQIVTPEQYQLILNNPSDVPKIEDLSMFPINYFTTTKFELIQTEIEQLTARSDLDREEVVDMSYYLGCYLIDLNLVLSNPLVFKGIVSQKYSDNPFGAISLSYLQKAENKFITFHNLQATKYALHNKILT